MATIERIPIKPVEEILISLTPEEAVVLKKVIGCVNIPGNRPRQIICSIFGRLGEVGINFDSQENFPYTELKI
ncbi:hypothetical protein LCGC14_2450740 [marine sediment metagenome]|uniref:Uncharacterized protein n=1 Tax=marine sediment metagenome TaxID=412755 RepID=A0A0F9BGM2_9ZZZZ